MKIFKNLMCFDSNFFLNYKYNNIFINNFIFIKILQFVLLNIEVKKICYKL